ncbi:MAG: hypothetical protein WC787_00720 [Patescibacteria group bacterium]|jgi:hypothetical protein
MTFRVYIAFMSAATVLSWGAWLLVLTNTNPDEAEIWGFGLFYLTLLLGLIGTLTLIGMAYRILILNRGGIMAREVRIAFRHAVFLSCVAVAALILSAQRFLTWWMFILLIIGMSVVEYLFLLREEARRS